MSSGDNNQASADAGAGGEEKAADESKEVMSSELSPPTPATGTKESGEEKTEDAAENTNSSKEEVEEKTEDVSSEVETTPENASPPYKTNLNDGGEAKSENPAESSSTEEVSSRQPRRRRGDHDGHHHHHHNGHRHHDDHHHHHHRDGDSKSHSDSHGGSRSRSHDHSRDRSPHRTRSRSRTRSSSPRNRTRSRSRSNNTRSRSPRNRARSRSKTKSRSPLNRARSRSRSVTRSRSPRSRARSRSRTRSRSGSRSRRISRSNDQATIDDLQSQVDDQFEELEEQNEILEEEIIEESKKTRNFIFFCGCFLFLVVTVAVVVTLVVALGKDPATSDPVKSAPTTPPVRFTYPPTGATMSPSRSPTLSPTQPLVYQPPNRDDCLRVQNGEKVLGQNFMIVKDFRLTLDVSVNPAQDPLSLIPQLDSSFQTLIIPDLVGCIDASQTTRRGLRKGSRKLGDISYIIGNVDKTIKYEEGEKCPFRSPKPCYRFYVVLRTYLKGEELQINIINLIEDSFEASSENPLLEKFGLPPPFTYISLYNVVSMIPTDSPTNVPSKAPTKAPSSAPSMSSASPTTPAPSARPSVSPTSRPSASPSPPPTSAPTCRTPRLEDYIDTVLANLDDANDDEDNELTWEIDCDEDFDDDIVVLYRKDDTCNAQCVGHLEHERYEVLCDAGADNYDILIPYEKEDFDDGRLLVGYLRDFRVDNVCEEDWEKNTITLV